jgi:hypothetical protein
VLFFGSKPFTIALAGGTMVLLKRTLEITKMILIMVLLRLYGMGAYGSANLKTGTIFFHLEILPEMTDS